MRRAVQVVRTPVVVWGDAISPLMFFILEYRDMLTSKPDGFSSTAIERGRVMQINVGSPDRIARIVVGLVLMLLAATGTVGWWGWIGIVPLLTGVFRFCPAYTLLGFNTCDAASSR